MAIVSNKLALAALTGLLSVGVLTAGAANAESNGNAGPAMKMEKNACKGKSACKSQQTEKEKHACKGLNSCKGQGADGKNECKGHGSCATDGSKDSKGSSGDNTNQ